MENTTNHCLPRIRSSYPQFSDKEKIIADYILNNPDKIIHQTINQIADDLQVAEATVFRFCKRIGFKGFQAMKIALASENITPIKEIHEQFSSEDDERTIAEKVFKSNISTLEQTMQVIDGKSIQKAVHAILNANRVEFYGNGGSGIVAADAHHKFLSTGIQTIAYCDSHLQLMSASQLTPEDVVVLISHSGANKDLLQALEIAKEIGATTIGITALRKSPISQAVDIPLYTVSEETELRFEALASRLAQLSIIDALYVNVGMGQKERMTSSIQKIRKAISHKRI